MTRIRLLVAAGGLLAMAAAPAFAATATSGQVNATATGALVGSFSDLPGVVDTHHDATAGLPTTLGVHSNVDVHGGTNNRVQSVSDVQASWTDANSGSITVADSWELDAFDRTAGVVVQATSIDQSLQRDLPNWQYAFDATGNDDLFTMNFNVSVTGDGAGLGAWNLRVEEDGNPIVPLRELSNGTAMGAFTQALQSGHHYIVTLTSNEGLAFVTDGRSTSRTVGIGIGNFDWSISGDAGPGTGAVPEPSAWALALAGFGLAGSALRRRRKALLGAA